MVISKQITQKQTYLIKINTFYNMNSRRKNPVQYYIA